MLIVLQIIVALLIIPMMCLGMMSGLSGGGGTPAFQRIGELLLILSPTVGSIAVVASFFLRRLGWVVLAYVVIIIPLVLWAGMMVWLQAETGFF